MKKTMFKYNNICICLIKEIIKLGFLSFINRSRYYAVAEGRNVGVYDNW